RRAKPQERLTTLDGEERELSTEMLVIADARRAVALAGVMGGSTTEVTPQTSNILLESASFNYVSIRRTSTQLRLHSEASFRFERGLSPGHTLPALKRATQLILELAGGQAASGVIDDYPGKREQPAISLSAKEVPRLLGIEMGLGEVKRALASLGFPCRKVSSSHLEVEVPPWRSDIAQVADVVEEIARIIGYDRIPTTSLK
ncbi:MAG: phenylalanine--tRNA ligase beta subunit-related protein, partial [Chloroflexota bacterium]